MGLGRRPNVLFCGGKEDGLCLALSSELGLGDGSLRPLCEPVLVVDDGQVLLGQILELFVLDLPELLRDLRDEPC